MINLKAPLPVTSHSFTSNIIINILLSSTLMHTTIFKLLTRLHVSVVVVTYAQLINKQLLHYSCSWDTFILEDDTISQFHHAFVIKLFNNKFSNINSHETNTLFQGLYQLIFSNWYKISAQC